MRLINADALKRIILSEGSYQNMVGVLEEEIDNAPTIDAEPVVRCKDCTHRYQHDSGRYFCEMYYGMGDVSDENYCSFGER